MYIIVSSQLNFFMLCYLSSDNDKKLDKDSITRVEGPALIEKGQYSYLHQCRARFSPISLARAQYNCSSSTCNARESFRKRQQGQNITYSGKRQVIAVVRVAALDRIEPNQPQTHAKFSAAVSKVKSFTTAS